MTKSKTQGSLTDFNLDNLQQLVGSYDEIEIDAYVEKDGNALILTPDLSNPHSVVRVPANFARVGEELPEPKGAEANKGAPRRVWIKRSTPALHILSEPFEEIIGSFIPKANIETLQVSVSFHANGEGTLTYGGKTIACLGSPEIPYTKDLTIQGIVGTDKFKRKFSNEYQVWMDWAVLIIGQRGIYIHEGADNLAENDGPSAGCIHIRNAKHFYDWVSGRTRVQISYPW